MGLYAGWSVSARLIPRATQPRRLAGRLMRALASVVSSCMEAPGNEHAGIVAIGNWCGCQARGARPDRREIRGFETFLA